MRLINTTSLQVEEFLSNDTVDYVILSHTWEGEEVTLQDIQSGAAISKKGYAKITSCCQKAARDGFTYCWIDTCCIDKTSSAELSEAINSMYQWYQQARICYAYLADFHGTSRDVQLNHPSFAEAKWFTRGWTLQELIAPSVVEFFNSKWEEIGTRLSLQTEISAITGINQPVLSGEDPSNVTVNVRMSWAAHRKTSRLEDGAYCLMGLFGVNMPLLYGEGSRAFRRLQEEIMRSAEDYTLLAWSTKGLPRTDPLAFSAPRSGLLADSPRDFADFHLGSLADFPNNKDSIWHRKNPPVSDAVISKCKREDFGPRCSLVLQPPVGHLPPYLTSRGMRISLPLLHCFETSYLACLTEMQSGQEILLLCLELFSSDWEEERYFRHASLSLVVVSSKSAWSGFKYRSIYVQQPPPNTIGRAFTSNRQKRTIPLLILKMDKDTAQNLKHVFSQMRSVQEVLAGAGSGEESLPDKFLMFVVQVITRPISTDVMSRLSVLSPEYLDSLTCGSPSSCFILDSKHPDPAPSPITLFFEDCEQGISIICALGSTPSCKVERLSNQGEIQSVPAETQLRLSDRRSIFVNEFSQTKEISPTSRIRINVSIRPLSLMNNQKDFDRYEISVTRERTPDAQSAMKMVERNADMAAQHDRTNLPPT